MAGYWPQFFFFNINDLGFVLVYKNPKTKKSWPIYSQIWSIMHTYGVDNSTKFFRLYFFWQISIFMTHLSNYGNDRLALLVFDSLVKHLQCWTNIKLSSEHPVELAERYFTMFPGEMEPIWQVFHLNAV